MAWNIWPQRLPNLCISHWKGDHAIKFISTLLVATDLSAPSRFATARAASIASASKARLELLHVIENRGMAALRDLFGDAVTSVTARLEEDFRAELAGLAAEICEPLGLSVGQHLRHGKVLDEITDLGDALDASLVVLGAHGAGFVRQILVGTTAERLLRRALRPLLVVRRPVESVYRRVLVAVDFSPGSLTAVKYARAVAPDATLTLFHAFEIPFEGRLRAASVEESLLDHYRAQARQQAMQGLHRLADEAGLTTDSYQVIVTHGTPGFRVMDAAGQVSADLIVMCKHGVSMTNELLLGSVTRYVLTETDRDVLVVR
ncbi:MAG: universal stress protein [Candidatus Dactylopiibacterium carminicum]|uniref:Universal stress protein n=1 Tax=Candidatus Dactylopiibacterium carminicum TaxID=857335 RepID=A0A272ES15_9RHOO|nr:universal stress protein [Candidatus Dactylopiibacterium carminicum]PAS92899.1 MAG: universal stress protein [Candidatus Dactylopiibacterium carminicum]